jgi:hypothetical protein
VTLVARHLSIVNCPADNFHRTFAERYPIQKYQKCQKYRICTSCLKRKKKKVSFWLVCSVSFRFGIVSVSFRFSSIWGRTGTDTPHFKVKMQDRLTNTDWKIIGKEGAKRRAYNKDEVIVEEGDRIYRIYQIGKGTFLLLYFVYFIWLFILFIYPFYSSVCLSIQ